MSGTVTGWVNGSSIGTDPEYWAQQDNSPAGFTSQENGTRFVDVNGDGLADIVRNDGGVYRLYLNTSSSTLPSAYQFSLLATSSIQGVLPQFKYTSGSSFVTSGLFGNLNGDGAVDYVAGVSALSNTRSAYLGNGQGWNATSTIYLPYQDMPGYAGTPVTNSQLVDVNGDGLDDWIYSTDTITYACLNTGFSWGSCSNGWTIATSTYYKVTTPLQYFDHGVRILDVNGDGFPDFVRSYSNTTNAGTSDAEPGTASFAYLNTGSGWATSTVTFNYLITTFTGSNIQTNREAYDSDGDGVPVNTDRHDMLATIAYPQQGTTQVSYANPGYLGGNAQLGLPRLVVTQLVSNDQNGNVDTRSYTYAGGKLYGARGIIDRQFASFASITETRSDGTRKTYFNQGDAVDTASGEQSDDFAFIGKAYREDVTATSSTLLKRTFSKWLKSSMTTASTTSATATTSDFFTLPGDGSIRYWNTTDFATAHNASTGTNGGASGVDQGAIFEGSTNWKDGSAHWLITRSFLPIDTRSLPTNATISSSTLYVRGYKYVIGGNLSLVPSTQATSTTLVDGDYGRVDFATQLATDKDSNDFGTSPGSLQSWALNAAGIAAIGKGTSTRFAIITSADRNNAAPTDNSGLANVYSSRAASDKPFLRVTYSAGTTTADVPGSTAFAFLDHSMTQWFDQSGNGGHKDRASEFTYSTSTGDALTQVDKGEVTGATDGTYTDTASDTRTTTRSYARNETNNLTGLKPTEAFTLTRLMLAVYAYQTEGLLMTKSDVMRAIGAEHISTARAYADQAVELGFITIKPSSTDKRMQLLVPTPKGIERVQKMLAVVRESAKWLNAVLTADAKQHEFATPLSANLPPIGELAIISDPVSIDNEEKAKLAPQRSVQRYLDAFSETQKHIRDHIPAMRKERTLYFWLDAADKSLAVSEKLERLEPGKHLLALASAHLQLGNYQKAIEVYSKQIEIDGKNYGALSQRAKAHLGAKDYRRALEDVLAIGKIAPGFQNMIPFRLLQAAALAGLKRYDEALNVFQQLREEVVEWNGEVEANIETLSQMMKRDPSLQGLLNTVAETRAGMYDLNLIEAFIREVSGARQRSQSV